MSARRCRATIEVDLGNRGYGKPCHKRARPGSELCGEHKAAAEKERP